LMDVPTGEFTTEDIRLMIGQDMGVEYLLPLAIKLLRQDPFAEGMYYEGDLLASVIRIKADFWRSNPIWHSEARSIVRGISEVPIEIKGEVERFLQIPQGDAR
ncbi:MAG: hypothetical protein H8F28_13475, partial [Fibrella sp.]|nr:hypothetical protein [Armatimonadota bacterium]